MARFEFRGRKAAALLAASLLAIVAAGCSKSMPPITGSLASQTSEPQTPEGWLNYSEEWGRRFEADPGDKTAALNYARALRAREQRAQAVAVLQQAAIRSPHDLDILGAYGRALSEAGRLKEAAEVLAQAHTPERPDWRILSVQGTVADQLGDHAQAQLYYRAALKIVPDEPSVQSNLGLSYALASKLGDAERTLREASEHPRADKRVRENLALVLGLQGKFDEAEGVYRRDLSPAEASANVAYLKQSVTQQNSWAAIRSLDGRGKTQSVAKNEPKSEPKGESKSEKKRDSQAGTAAKRQTSELKSQL
jgi:Flp pilus assembly protein TadD